MRNLPNLNGLRAFEATARLGSFAAAGAEMHVTPGAVSQQVRSLETRLGIALFERRPQALILSPAGRTYLPNLSEAFDRIDAATRQLIRPNLRTILTLAMPAAFATGWLLPRIEAFHRAHVTIEVRIDSTTRRVEPDSDGIDAVIRRGRGGFGDLACWHLFGDQLVVVCSPAYLADRGAARLSDLASHTLLEALDASDDWPDWQHAHDRIAGNVARRLSFGDTRLAIDAALHGLGIALVDRHLVDAELAEGRLIAPFAAEPWRRGTAWYFVHTTARQDEAPIRALREWLLQQTDGPMP